MADYDVVVIGAGVAGLSAGALLATEGKRVLVTDRSPVLGGRAMAVPDEGFKVNVGGHLIEDPGSGLTKVFEHVGKELVHGAVSAEMPVWDHEYKIAWLGLYLATEEPVAQLDPRELSTWLRTPTTDTPGFMFNMTAMDPSCSPAGTNLHVMGAVIPGEKGRDQRFLRDTLLAFEEGIKVMWPGFARPVWRRRHLVFEPSFGVIQKPGLVGMYRPHWRAPNVDGLYFASETFRSRGVGTDRAARAAVTVVEDYLSRRLATFGDGWRY